MKQGLNTTALTMSPTAPIIMVYRMSSMYHPARNAAACRRKKTRKANQKNSNHYAHDRKHMNLALEVLVVGWLQRVPLPTISLDESTTAGEECCQK